MLCTVRNIFPCPTDPIARMNVVGDDCEKVFFVLTTLLGNIYARQECEQSYARNCPVSSHKDYNNLQTALQKIMCKFYTKTSVKFASTATHLYV